jgi:hypothetical protein
MAESTLSLVGGAEGDYAREMSDGFGMAMNGNDWTVNMAYMRP